MRAWHVEAFGAPTDVMRLVDIADLEPGPGQVAVRVAACTLGFPDVLMCRAGYHHKPALPFSPGADFYGEVVALGPDVDLDDRGVKVGSKVIAIGAGLHGGLADIALVDLDLVFPAPAGLDPAESAALFGAYLTGWLALHRGARIAPGEVLLVHAAAGGVGSAAVQLGLAAGATVIGVTRGARKAAVAAELGAHIVIDREQQSVIDVVKEATDGRGADVAFDPVGGPSWFESTKCVAFEGRLVVIGFAGGEIASQPVNHPLVKNYSIIGINSGLYTVERPDVVAQALSELSELAARGLIKPLVGERVPLGDAPRALQDLADGLTVGRSVVMLDESIR